MFSLQKTVRKDSIKQEKLLPDLILMDLRMPKITGIECLKMLQKDEDLKEIPVIIITAYKTDEDFTEAFKNGVFDFITKPIDINELISRINKALSIGLTLQRIRAKITQYEQERKALKEKATLTDNAPNAFIIIDSKGNLEWANEGFERLHEISFDDFKQKYGSNVYDIKLFKDFTREAQQCILTKQPSSLEAKIILPNGKKKWFQIFMTPQINEDKEIFKLIAVESDITLIMNKEEHLSKQNKRMLAITERLELANSLLESQKEEIEEKKRLIEEEQEKSERLLLNILPFEVARQLKSKGKAGTRFYRHVSVLFTDFKDFSKNTKELEPTDLEVFSMTTLHNLMRLPVNIILKK